MPFVSGNEGAGDVIAVGPGVTDIKVGDRVGYTSALGSYAAERILPADRPVKLPDAISYEQAAAMMLKGLTAQYLLRQTYKVQKGDNILVHGIGAQAQLTGVDPGEALHAFVDFVAEAPLIAFHAHFDRTFLVRAIKGYVDRPLDNPWLDLAALAPAVDPAARLKSLDEWLQRYQIPVAARHSAAADAFATALLAARLLTLARRQGASDFGSLQRLAGAARWLQ